MYLIQGGNAAIIERSKSLREKEEEKRTYAMMLRIIIIESIRIETRLWDVAQEISRVL